MLLIVVNYVTGSYVRRQTLQYNPLIIFVQLLRVRTHPPSDLLEHYYYTPTCRWSNTLITLNVFTTYVNQTLQYNRLMNVQLICLYEWVQETIIEIISLRQYDIQQLFSSSCRSVTAAQSLNFFKLFLVQCTSLIEMTWHFSGIHFLRYTFMNAPNTSL